MVQHDTHTHTHTLCYIKGIHSLLWDMCTSHMTHLVSQSKCPGEREKGGLRVRETFHPAQPAVGAQCSQVDALSTGNKNSRLDGYTTRGQPLETSVVLARPKNRYKGKKVACFTAAQVDRSIETVQSQAPRSRTKELRQRVGE